MGALRIARIKRASNVALENSCVEFRDEPVPFARRPLKIEVPGPERVIYRDGKEPPTVVEKDDQRRSWRLRRFDPRFEFTRIVVRYIDQIVLIPRSGIRETSFERARSHR